jgi:DinB family protein
MPQLTLNEVDALSHTFYTGGGPVSAESRKHSREEIIAFLEANVDDLCREVQDMTPQQLSYRLPGTPTGPDESGDEEHFDSAQIMTHMASAVGFHWWNMTRAMRHERPPMPRPPEGAAVTGKNKNVMGGGGWQGLSPTELCTLLRDTTHGLVAYVRQLPADTNDARSSFGLFRDMSPHDWLFVVAVHAGMHLLQIREMKAQPDFPVSSHSN